MISAEEIFQFIKKEVDKIYPNKGESRQITFMLMEHLFQLNRNDILKNEFITNDDVSEKILPYINRLKNNEPIQYVIGYTEFYGYRFNVSKDVLIPRPETEELVDLIIKEYQGKLPLDILDIGSGSGCIPIVLKKELMGATISSMDVSDKALIVARQNAANLQAEVLFIHDSILKPQNTYEKFDIIVSNPPYVTETDKKEMQPNVLNHEPSLALFVSDDYPLVFYKAIAEFSKVHLKDNGSVYLEINEGLSYETADVFKKAGFSSTKIIKDLNGKDRMIKAE